MTRYKVERPSSVLITEARRSTTSSTPVEVDGHTWQGRVEKHFSFREQSVREK